ncbi:MAG: hypothetical protein LKJ47_04140 [Bifidobacteriaceae bacterium]|jgi:leader peptidase (prepilin peptidase)/N-methyltransferase|nr:hypothetical protein [Bifidobacteriaceae bacterium]
MHYLSLMPSLIAAVLLCVTDVRTRRVPRSVVAAGFVSQILVFAAVALFSWQKLGTAIVLALCCGLVQLVLTLIRPGAIGLGDATATTLMAVGIAMFHGIAGLCVWWLLMGLIGLATLLVSAHSCSHSRSHNHTTDTQRGAASIPFVPVIVAAAVLTYVMAAVW